jgi:hypothetical protein
MPHTTEIRTALQRLIDAAVFNFQTQMSAENKTESSAQFVSLKAIVANNDILKSGRLLIKEALVATLSVTNEFTSADEFKKKFVRTLEEAFDLDLYPTTVPVNPPSANKPAIEQHSKLKVFETKPSKIPALALNSIPTNTPTPPPLSITRHVGSALQKLRTLFQSKTEVKTSPALLNVSDALLQQKTTLRKLLAQHQLSLRDLLFMNKFSIDHVDMLEIEYVCLMSAYDDDEGLLEHFFAEKQIRLDSLHIKLPTPPKKISARIQPQLDDFDMLDISESDSESTKHAKPVSSMLRADLPFHGVQERPLTPFDPETGPEWLSFEPIDDDEISCSSGDSIRAVR